MAVNTECEDRDALIREARAFTQEMAKDFARFADEAVDSATETWRAKFARKAAMYAMCDEALAYFQAAREEA